MTDFQSLSRSFQKKMARTKEKVLMTFGKADRTMDDDFEVLSKSFHYQQVTANKLLRHYKTYTQQVKGMSSASKNLHQVMCEAYEPNWEGSESFAAATEQLNTLWDDHFVQVSDFLNFQLASYACKFPELKGKIDKRGRKLLDYDRTRHKVDNMERSKKRDDGKINGTIRELDAAQTIYEGINQELFEELPVLYDNRMPFLSKFFNSFLKVESTFEKESSKIKMNLLEINAVLPKDPAKVIKNRSLHSLKAKTLPRREPVKTYSAARYSPIMGRTNTGKPDMGDDRRKTMPARPSSPPFPSHFLKQHHPPAPMEPAPLPPITSSSSSSSSSSNTRSETATYSKASGEPAIFMKPSQIGSLTSKSPSGSSLSSSHPVKPPPPKMPYSPTNQSNSPKFGQPINSYNNSSSLYYSTPTSALPDRWNDEKYANTSDIINYIPQLNTPLSITNTSTSPSINTSPTLNGKVSLANQDIKVELPGFTELKMAATDASDNLTNASHTTMDKGKKIIENIYTNVARTASETATKAGEAAEKVGDAVNTKAAEVTSKIGMVYDAPASNGDVSIDCTSPGTITSSTTIQVSDIVDSSKKVPGDSVNITTSGGVTEVTSSTTSIKTINSPTSDKDIVVTNETISSILLPTSSYLFKVQATNNYKAADTDELSVDAGDVIYVLPIENIDLEDEGWALGLKQKDGAKGMFPVNFTRKIV